MTGTKTNERPGTRAVVRHSGVSAYKAREVLNLIRGKDYQRASEILEYCDREVATVIGKVLKSAASNAFHNDGIDPEELFVSACYADEGTTLKRWRPRARGRATRIRKRTCHVTVIVSRMGEEELARRRARVAAESADRRARRVAGARRRARAGAAGGAEGITSPEIDEQVLEIVSAGETTEPPEIDAAVEQALAAGDEEVQAESVEDAAGESDDEAESADDAAGDDETSD
ncbi:MAG: 50S ribosomal protein L22 [Acidimicrobiales bacterium]|jgi:large subunit ribosomal protein L22